MLFVNQKSGHIKRVNMLVRSFIASIVPSLMYIALLYCVNFYPEKKMCSKLIEYEVYFGILIGIIASIYPFDQISLLCLFEPIEFLCDQLIKGDLSQN